MKIRSKFSKRGADYVDCWCYAESTFSDEGPLIRLQISRQIEISELVRMDGLMTPDEAFKLGMDLIERAQRATVYIAERAGLAPKESR